jgi:hypothetical protein
MPPKYTVIPPKHSADRKPPGSSRAANKLGKKQGMKDVPKPVGKRRSFGSKLPPSSNPNHRHTGGKWCKEVRDETEEKYIAPARLTDAKAVIEYVVSIGLERPALKRGSRRPAYDKALGLVVCGIIACSATGLIRAIELLQNEGIELEYIDVLQWKETNKEFAKLYEEARTRQAEYMQDLAAHAAVHSLPGDVTKTVRKWSPELKAYTTETTEIRSDNINRSRLIVETIMRRSALLNPKWRDKGNDNSDAPNAQLEALVAALAGGPADGE